MSNTTYTTTCCICGGGPAGVMLGYLLARAGVEVIVLEKHKDFFRDFRGDTIHPSTIQLMYELGLLDEFLQVPHQEIKQLSVVYNGTNFTFADFTHLPIAKPMLALMPQWDFLNFLKSKADAYNTFKLITEAEANQLITTNNIVTGVQAQTPNGTIAINAKLVVAADGRTSTIRKLANLPVASTGVPIDVLWFSLPRKGSDPEQTFGRFDHGKIMVLLQRDTYWQCGYVIAKGDFEKIKQGSLTDFQQELATVSPFLKDSVQALKTWDDIKLLSVTIDHLKTWHKPGLLCIGDAAHAMSPVGGVGINLAVQDAVATANILYKTLRNKQTPSNKLLHKVQRRRLFPARVIQRAQVIIQKGIKPRSNGQSGGRMPLFFRLIKNIPWLTRLPARFVGMGVRPEHIKIKW